MAGDPAAAAVGSYSASAREPGQSSSDVSTSHSYIKCPKIVFRTNDQLVIQLQALQLQKAVAGGWGAAAAGADATGAEPAHSSSAAALRAHYAVQRFVALTQLQQARSCRALRRSYVASTSVDKHLALYM